MNIRNIRLYLKSKIGSKVVVVYNGARNKRERYVGVLDKVYANVFSVRLTNGNVKCFSFIDILVKTIQIYI